jgi:acrylyl-CoA reductase (NADPH)
MCPREPRLEAWERLRKDLPMEKLQAMSLEAALSDVPRLAAEILKGQVRGRVVVNLKS